jgi:biopolymer transport protein ExbD
LAAILLYLATLSFSIFGGGEVPGMLREYEFIDAPAQYAEQSLNIDEPAEPKQTGTIHIVVAEDKIFYNEQEITVEDLEQIVSDTSAQKAELADQNAKHVTYSKVHDELERLGVIIDEVD